MTEKRESRKYAPIAAVAATIGAIAGSFIVNKLFEDSNNPDLEVQVAEAAAELRKQLPMKVDDQTTLQSVVSAGNSFVYHYTVSVNGSDVDLPTFSATMQKQLTAYVCESPTMAPSVKKGVEYIYIHMSADAVRLSEVAIDKADCGF
ncbi:hypothetical protein [Gimibacter soli]|uniref:Uncharacterized protein n=1 Tax=Gimibacter soli TaxID=3024400 RepID=A0AAE9XWH1_9PROT|nr:hypothetical protein [Gimibacter soli]WCL55758.1 hypothetical protein PH603_08315 [Gimibacter soli]